MRFCLMRELRCRCQRERSSPGGQRKPPLFGRVSRRVPAGNVAPAASCSPLWAVFAEASESFFSIPSGSCECSDNSSRNPWLSEKNSGMACFPATPYQNFYVREEAEA